MKRARCAVEAERDAGAGLQDAGAGPREPERKRIRARREEERTVVSRATGVAS